MNSSRRRIAAHYLLQGRKLVKNPLLEVEGRRIVRIEQCQTPDSVAGVEFYSGILLPGLVNAHAHLELSYLRGAIPQGGGGGAFAAAMAAVRDRYTAEQRREAAAEADGCMWEQGIEAVGDICNSAETLSLKAASPIHYRSFAEVFGLRQDNYAQMQQLCTTPDMTLTPHSMYSLQDALLRRVACEGGDLLSVHFEETTAEKELFQGRGSLYDWYRQMGFQCDFLQYGMPSERLVESVPAEKRLLLVHNCCITPIDVEIVMNHFRDRVSWCLCPRSNYYISATKPCSHRLLRRYGARICVGTDSLASNTSLALVDELKYFEDVPLAERLWWATGGGAEALGMQAELGEFLQGRTCGVVLLEGVDYEHMQLRATARTRRLV